jgi:hypothetical protein
LLLLFFLHCFQKEGIISWFLIGCCFGVGSLVGGSIAGGLFLGRCYHLFFFHQLKIISKTSQQRICLWLVVCLLMVGSFVVVGSVVLVVCWFLVCLWVVCLLADRSLENHSLLVSIFVGGSIVGGSIVG